MIRQYRLYLAETLFHVILWLMPESKEKDEFCVFSINYCANRIRMCGLCKKPSGKAMFCSDTCYFEYESKAILAARLEK